MSTREEIARAHRLFEERPNPPGHPLLTQATEALMRAEKLDELAGEMLATLSLKRNESHSIGELRRFLLDWRERWERNRVIEQSTSSAEHAEPTPEQGGCER